MVHRTYSRESSTHFESPWRIIGFEEVALRVCSLSLNPGLSWLYACASESCNDFCKIWCFINIHIKFVVWVLIKLPDGGVHSLRDNWRSCNLCFLSTFSIVLCLLNSKEECYQCGKKHFHLDGKEGLTEELGGCELKLDSISCQPGCILWTGRRNLRGYSVISQERGWWLCTYPHTWLEY